MKPTTPEGVRLTREFLQELQLNHLKRTARDLRMFADHEQSSTSVQSVTLRIKRFAWAPMRCPMTRRVFWLHQVRITQQPKGERIGSEWQTVRIDPA